MILGVCKGDHLTYGVWVQGARGSWILKIRASRNCPADVWSKKRSVKSGAEMISVLEIVTNLQDITSI